MNVDIIALEQTAVDKPNSKINSCGYRFKRMLLLASLYFKLTNTNAPGEEQLVKANTCLKLAHRAGALAFPAALSTMIWSKIDGDKLLEQYNADDGVLPMLVLQVLDAAPKWCRYDTAALLSEEIRFVLESIRFA